MKIFLDDEREPVDYLDWVIVRDYSDFVTTVLYATEDIDYISFDHDLGEDSLSGFECVKWLVNLDMERRGNILLPTFSWYVHSQNPVGAKNINLYLDNYLIQKFFPS